MESPDEGLVNESMDGASIASDTDDPEPEDLEAENPEVAAALEKSEHIDALRRRPGFREELLSAFSQIYRR